MKIDGRSMFGKAMGGRFAKCLEPLFIEFIKMLTEEGYVIKHKSEWEALGGKNND